MWNLNLFPRLLDFGFFAPTILRIILGLVLLRWAYRLAQGEPERLISVFNQLGFRPATAWVKVSALISLLTGSLLIIGLWTQAAALIVAVFSLLDLSFKKKHPRLMPESTEYYLFIAVISLSLLFTGAGAFAFDLPL